LFEKRSLQTIATLLYSASSNLVTFIFSKS
jgi:hypothetical protein